MSLVDCNLKCPGHDIDNLAHKNENNEVLADNVISEYNLTNIRWSLNWSKVLVVEQLLLS